jgi:hypothetical protein
MKMDTVLGQKLSDEICCARYSEYVPVAFANRFGATHGHVCAEPKMDSAHNCPVVQHVAGSKFNADLRATFATRAKRMQIAYKNMECECECEKYGSTKPWKTKKNE